MDFVSACVVSNLVDFTALAASSALPFHFIDNHVENISMWVGVVNGSQYFAAILGSLLTAKLATKGYPPLRLLRNLMLADAVCVIGIGFVNTPWLMVLLRFAMGICYPWTAATTSIIMYSSKEKVVFRQACVTGAGLIGTVLGNGAVAMYSLIGWLGINAMISAAAFCCAVLAFFADRKHAEPVHNDARFQGRGDTSGKLRKSLLLCGSKELFTLLLYVGTNNIVNSYLVFAFLDLILERGIDVSLLALLAVAAIIGCLVVGFPLLYVIVRFTRNVRWRTLITLRSIVILIVFASVQSLNTWSVLILTLVFFLPFFPIEPLLFGTMQHAAQTTGLPEVVLTSVVDIFSKVGQALGNYLGGFIYQETGLVGVCVTLAIFGIASVLLEGLVEMTMICTSVRKCRADQLEHVSMAGAPRTASCSVTVPQAVFASMFVELILLFKKCPPLPPQKTITQARVGCEEKADIKLVSTELGMTSCRLRGNPSAQASVFIHGFMSGSFFWDVIVDPVAASGKRWVLTFDRFGMGLSARSEETAPIPYNRRTHGKQVWALLDALEITDAVELIGVSYTLPLHEAVAQQPRRVKRVVLITPGVVAAPESMRWIPLVYSRFLRCRCDHAWKFFYVLQTMRSAPSPEGAKLMIERATCDFEGYTRMLADAMLASWVTQSEFHQYFRVMKDNSIPCTAVLCKEDKEVLFQPTQQFLASHGVMIDSIEGGSHFWETFPHVVTAIVDHILEKALHNT